MVIGSGALLLVILIALAFWASVRVVLRSGTQNLIKALRWAMRTSFVMIIAYKGYQVVYKLIPGTLVDAEIQTSGRFWPTLPHELVFRSDAVARVVSGGFQYAEVTVSNLTQETRIVLALTDFSFGVLVLALLWILNGLLTAASQGFAFRTLSMKVLRKVAWLVLWLGELGSLLFSWGSSLVARDLTPSSAAMQAPASISNPFSQGLDPLGTVLFGRIQPSTYLNYEVTVWPILACLILLVAATLLAKGREVQAATEGLV